VIFSPIQNLGRLSSGACKVTDGSKIHELRACKDSDRLARLLCEGYESKKEEEKKNLHDLDRVIV